MEERAAGTLSGPTASPTSLSYPHLPHPTHPFPDWTVCLGFPGVGDQSLLFPQLNPLLTLWEFTISPSDVPQARDQFPILALPHPASLLTYVHHQAAKPGRNK